MSKHPGPWKLFDSGNLYDATRTLVCTVMTDDPEARAVLLHAAEMWEALEHVFRHLTYHHPSAETIGTVLSKIKSEIAKARRS